MLGASYGSARDVRRTRVTGCARVTKHTRVAVRTRVAKHTRIAGQARLQNAWERRVLSSIGKKRRNTVNQKTPGKGCKIQNYSSIQKYKQTKYMKIMIKKTKTKKKTQGKNKTKQNRNIWKAQSIDQFPYIKIQPKTIDHSTRVWGITTELMGFIPWSLIVILRCIVLGWVSIYRNWVIECYWAVFMRNCSIHKHAVQGGCNV